MWQSAPLLLPEKDLWLCVCVCDRKWCWAWWLNILHASVCVIFHLNNRSDVHKHTHTHTPTHTQWRGNCKHCASWCFFWMQLQNTVAIKSALFLQRGICMRYRPTPPPPSMSSWHFVLWISLGIQCADFISCLFASSYQAVSKIK